VKGVALTEAVAKRPTDALRKAESTAMMLAIVEEAGLADEKYGKIGEAVCL
jgi:hypothetical protein